MHKFFDDEGKKLLARRFVNLHAIHCANDASIYIGDQVAAMSRDILNNHKITRVCAKKTLNPFPSKSLTMSRDILHNSNVRSQPL